MSLHWIVLCPQMAKNSHQQKTLLSMKQGSLFCFVLSHWDVPHHSASRWALGIFSWWVWVHWLGLRLFGATMWKLLIIEPFSEWNLNKTQTENCIRIWECSWCCWKAFDESDLIEFINTFCNCFQNIVLPSGRDILKKTNHIFRKSTNPEGRGRNTKRGHIPFEGL